MLDSENRMCNDENKLPIIENERCGSENVMCMLEYKM